MDSGAHSCKLIFRRIKKLQTFTANKKFMRRLKKIFKWTVFVLITLVSVLIATVLLRQNIKNDRPYPDIRASADTAVIARGRHLVFSSAHCADCHSKMNADSLLHLGLDVPLTGGVLFDLPVGKIYSKNITPDSETGIGKYSDKEIARALRFGVHPDGTVVYDFMPFHNMADEDLTAVISYLRSQKPVRQEVPEHQLNVVGKIVKAFLIKPVGPSREVPSKMNADTSAIYGSYLANNIANCNGCHTRRSITGEYIGEPFAGGEPMIEKGIKFLPPNLTPDSTGRIFSWSKETFLERFRSGKLILQSPMPWNSFKRMTDDELKAIYSYLKTIKPVKSIANPENDN
jgi:mono/diheme cytochrome c family protein